jgi:TPR repeat protein
MKPGAWALLAMTLLVPGSTLADPIWGAYVPPPPPVRYSHTFELKREWVRSQSMSSGSTPTYSGGLRGTGGSPARGDDSGFGGKGVGDPCIAGTADKDECRDRAEQIFKSIANSRGDFGSDRQYWKAMAILDANCHKQIDSESCLAAFSHARPGDYGYRDQDCQLLSTACHFGNQDGCRMVGTVSADRGDMGKAGCQFGRDELQYACDHASPEACGGIGTLDSIEKHDQASMQSHYQQACDGGSARFCMELGFALPDESPGALAAYDAACKLDVAQGCAWAAKVLGIQRGAEAEITRRVERGCKLGDGPACARYAVALQERGDLAGASEAAAAACDKSGESDRTSCALRMWYDFYGFLGAKSDPKAVARYYDETCKSERPGARSCGMYGVLLAQGRGVDKDVARALPLLEASCPKRVTGESVDVACATLADLYTNGDGVDVNARRARDFGKQACRIDRHLCGITYSRPAVGADGASASAAPSAVSQAQPSSSPSIPVAPVPTPPPPEPVVEPPKVDLSTIHDCSDLHAFKGTAYFEPGFELASSAGPSLSFSLLSFEDPQPYIMIEVSHPASLKEQMNATTRVTFALRGGTSVSVPPKWDTRGSWTVTLQSADRSLDAAARLSKSLVEEVRLEAPQGVLRLQLTDVDRATIQRRMRCLLEQPPLQSAVGSMGR